MKASEFQKAKNNISIELDKINLAKQKADLALLNVHVKIAEEQLKQIKKNKGRN